MSELPSSISPGDSLGGSVSEYVTVRTSKTLINVKADITVLPGESLSHALLRLEATLLDGLEHMTQAYAEYTTQKKGR